MPIPSSKEIIELVKLGATLPAQEKILELRILALELQEENLTLKSRVKELETELNQKKNLRHERGLYWMDADKVPYCPHCFENASKHIHLAGPIANLAASVEGWACHVCHNDYFAVGEKAFMPNLNRRRLVYSTAK